MGSTNKKEIAGFIFAFYVYSGNEPSLVENVVHSMTELVTGSNLIHVDVVPVVRSIGDHLLIDNEAYTALMGLPFKRHCASRCFDDEFSLVYLPLTVEGTAHGVGFLRQLEGRPYAMCKLPLAAMPYSLKTCIGKSVSRQQTRSVFCSEAALMLCLECGMLTMEDDEDAMPPSACTPGDLYKILIRNRAKHLNKQNVHMFFSKFCRQLRLESLLYDHKTRKFKTSYF